VGRCTHLLKRLDGRPEAGYQDFNNAEESFRAMQPRSLSLLTDRLLSSIDYDACKKQRSINFHFLHEELKHQNKLNLDMSRIDGPMCYPFLIDDATIRPRLQANRVFVSKYWPEVEGRVKLGSVEKKLLDRCLPLPCDQRYRQQDMERIIKLVKGEN
jgi:hypothetical protein